jgi:hypothetical protein
MSSKLSKQKISAFLLEAAVLSAVILLVRTFGFKEPIDGKLLGNTALTGLFQTAVFNLLLKPRPRA